jgi:thiamine-monophosphate kinase
VVDVVVLGRAERPVTRAGARPGDGVWVSGRLGGARAALTAWLRGATPRAAARDCFAHPRPRLALGQALAAAGTHAMLDLSDGLGGDCRHLAAASGCALDIQLDLLPLHPDVAAAAEVERLAPAQFAALGGEDYELLAALPPEFGEENAARISGETGVPLTRIGTVHQGSGVSFHLAGMEVALRGFDHFG